MDCPELCICCVLPGRQLVGRKCRLAVASPSTVLMGIAVLLIPLSAIFIVMLVVSLMVGFGNGTGISSGFGMILGADLPPDRGRAKFLGIWPFMFDAGSTDGPALLSAVTAASTLATGVSPPASWSFLAAAVFAVYGNSGMAQWRRTQQGPANLPGGAARRPFP